MHDYDAIENQECPELPDPPNGQVHLTGRHFQVIFIKSACVHVYIDIEIEVIQTPIPEKLQNPISERLADIFFIHVPVLFPHFPFSKPPKLCRNICQLLLFNMGATVLCIGLE